MKRLIKMQPKYTVDYGLFAEGDKVIVVSNYDGSLNEVNMWPISSIDRKDIAETDIGIWKAKCIHDWKTNITDQYQQCKKCGIGHAL